MDESPVATLRGRVLLAEDHAALAHVLAQALAHEGYSVVHAADGHAAMESLRTGAFDVLVSDIAMPGLSGLDVLRAVREHDPDIPVILMTGAPSLHSATLAVEHGAFQYLAKPFPTALLLVAVAKACQLHRVARLKREAMQHMGRLATEAGDRAGLEAGFQRMLKGMWMAFQPIVDALSGRVIAFEALLRSEEPSLPHPGAVLEAAERLGRIVELGRNVRARAAHAYVAAEADSLLFLNLHVLELNDPQLLAPDSPLTAIAHRVVLEITERADLADVKQARARVEALRERGFRIAVDDLGAGYAGLTSFAALEPEFVKLDMSLVRGVDASPVRKRLVGAMVAACHDMGISLVAEGVETPPERQTLLELGCALHQGYLYARPARPFPTVTWPDVARDAMPTG